MNMIIDDGLAGVEMLIKYLGVVGKAAQGFVMLFLGAAVVVSLLPFAVLYWIVEGIEI